MKRKYNKIVKAILKKSEEEKIDERDLIRKWIMLFEETRINDWSRDEFLDEVIRVMKENEEIKRTKK